MEFVFNAVLFGLSIVYITEAVDWNYKEQAKWYDLFEECSSNKQSPIEINSQEAIPAFFIPPLQFYNYNITCRKSGKITNSGHTATIDLSKKCLLPQLSGGPLPYNAKYKAIGFHFHWGSKDAHGSEHIIDSQRHSMETHVVHLNVKYPSLEEALKHRDGLVVLGIFYDAKQTTKKPFKGLQNITKSLQAIKRFNATYDINDLRLDDLLGDIDTSRFYTYEGSLTTPPCSQAVTWIVFPQIIDITGDQMRQFRTLFDKQGQPMVNNYRFLQSKGKRAIYYRSEIVSSHKRQPITPKPFDAEMDYDLDNDIGRVLQ